MPDVAPRLGEFSAIDAEGRDLLEFTRPAAFAALLQGRSLLPARFDGQITLASTASVAAAACVALDLSVPGLADDIASLSDRFLTELARDSARFRLEIATETSCPQFHIDTLHVRLIATYVGQGTEFADQRALDQVEHLATGSVGLFKGLQHPTHTGRVRHRSPVTTPESPRLVLILDY